MPGKSGQKSSPASRPITPLKSAKTPPSSKVPASKRRPLPRGCNFSSDLPPSEILVSMMNEGAAIITAQGSICYVNHRLVEMLGQPEKEVVGKSFSQFIADEDQGCYQALLNQARSEALREEVRLKTAVGDLLTVQIALHHAARRGHDLVLMLTDLHLQKHLESEKNKVALDLQLRARELTALCQAAHLLRTQAHRPLPEVLQQLVALVTAACQDPEATAARISFEGIQVATSRFSEAAAPFTAPLLLSNGQRGQLDAAVIRAQPGAAEDQFLKEERALIHAVADLLASHLEPRQAEAPNAARKSRSGKADAQSDQVPETGHETEADGWELEAYADFVSQDLAGALAGVSEFMESLKKDRGIKLTSALQQREESLSAQADELARFSQALLEWTSVGRRPLKKQTVRTPDLVKQALVEVGLAGEGRRIDLQVGDLPPCQADPGMLKQVWIHLIANALQFTRARKAPCVEIGSETGGAGVVYYIRDNGVGFEMDEGEAFLNSPRRPHHGPEEEKIAELAIAARIIRRHGGRIWAEAEPGKGATFRFVL